MGLSRCSRSEPEIIELISDPDMTSHHIFPEAEVQDELLQFSSNGCPLQLFMPSSFPVWNFNHQLHILHAVVQKFALKKVLI